VNASVAVGSATVEAQIATVPVSFTRSPRTDRVAERVGDRRWRRDAGMWSIGTPFVSSCGAMKGRVTGTIT
jgi:hypothetical protein